MNLRTTLILLAALVTLPLAMAADATAATRTVTIPQQIADKQLKLPASSMIVRNGIPGVFIARNGLARFAMIKPGRKYGGAIEILAGLLPGDRVILDPADTLHDGSPVGLKQQE